MWQKSGFDSFSMTFHVKYDKLIKSATFLVERQRGNIQVRMLFYRYFTAMFVTLAMSVFTIPALAAELENANSMMETTTETDIIDDTSMVDDDLLWDGEIPADIRWKTKQDKGQWIEELDVIDGAKSLILVVNGAKETDENIGYSTLIYLSKNMEGEWLELFSTDCVISGEKLLENNTLHGIYDPVKTFGNRMNPGSLLPYRELTSDDYWILDPKDERYGDIYTIQPSTEKVAGAVNLKSMKIFFDYGMVMKARDNESDCASVLFNCYQTDAKIDEFVGIQIPAESLRMLIQCVDDETCMMIVGSADELANMKKETIG